MLVYAAETLGISSDDRTCDLAKGEIPIEFTHQLGRALGPIDCCWDCTVGIEPVEVVAQLLHTEIHCDGGFKQQRAGCIGFERAHRDFAALERDRIAARIKALQSHRA